MPVINLRDQRKAWLGGVEQTGMWISGAKVWAKPPEATPEISISTGGGYAGSVYQSTVAGQWTADGAVITGAVGLSYTMSRDNEGKAIRCGSSNSIEMWMPTDLDPSLKRVWLDPKINQSVVGGFITSWADNFGTADFSQATAGMQPTANIDEYGDPYASFTNGAFIESASAMTTPYIAFVSQYKTGAETSFDQYQILIGDTSSHRVQGDAGGTSNRWATNAMSKNGAASSRTCLPMPKSMFMGVPSRATTNLPIRVGTSFTQFWPGGIWEFIVLSATPTDTVKAILEGCLAHRNGIASLLPSGHPFRVSGPIVS